MKRRVVFHLFECPSCHRTLRLTLKRRELKEVLKGKREVCKYRVEVIE